MPRDGDLDLTGLEVDPGRVRAATAVDVEEWEAELASQAELYDKLSRTLPASLRLQRELLRARV